MAIVTKNTAETVSKQGGARGPSVIAPIPTNKVQIINGTAPFTLADDKAAAVVPPCTSGIVSVFIATATTSYAMLVKYRCIATAACAAVATLADAAAVEFSTAALADAGGTDAKFAMSAVAADGKLYFSNRLGAAAEVRCVFM